MTQKHSIDMENLLSGDYTPIKMKRADFTNGLMLDLWRISQNRALQRIHGMVQEALSFGIRRNVWRRKCEQTCDADEKDQDSNETRETTRVLCHSFSCC